MTRVLVLMLFLAAQSAFAAEVRVSAAASLMDVLRELGTAYEVKSADRIVFNFGASSTLARQISEGAPADLFLSADDRQMDRVALTARRLLLSNTLVIAGVKRPADLTHRNIRRIAIANPAHVPAGVYAKEYLTKLGLWRRVAPKLVPTDNVRAALAALESGNADAAIVYKTDLRGAKKVAAAYHVPEREGPRISYPVAILRASRQPAAARRFYDFLGTPAAAAVFRRHGFLVR